MGLLQWLRKGLFFWLGKTGILVDTARGKKVQTLSLSVRWDYAMPYLCSGDT